MTRRAGIIGPLVNRRVTTIAAASAAAFITALNIYLLCSI
jgi:Mn2+/Fe2+ NRAMP family transporter